MGWPLPVKSSRPAAVASASRVSAGSMMSRFEEGGRADAAVDTGTEPAEHQLLAGKEP